MEHIFWKWINFLVIFAMTTCAESNSPHIVFIMADDMGWQDVSYHGSDQIVTPNIDALAYHGVILQQYYTEPICTPARSALLTGKYPMRLGMQGYPLFNAEDRGIPLSERLLPSYLKDLGYSTHLVGKWHVGMSREDFLPTRRGFDSHYGMRGGFVDYYTYNKVENWPTGEEVFGLDLFDDMKPQTVETRYIVDVLTDRALDIINHHNISTPLFLQLAHNAPHSGNERASLQPPPEPKTRHPHIAHPDRRLYADVVAHLDYSIGRVVRALADKKILNDTIIVFISDNGAPTVGQFNNCGVNLPFRGIKATPWEGAVRTSALLWHSKLKPKVWDGLMHITDWLPTLIAAAGSQLDASIDGVNQWEAITQDQESKRNDVVITIDNLSHVAAYRAGDYKIVIGNLTGDRNGYYGEEFMKVKYQPHGYFPKVQASDVAQVMESIGKRLDLNNVTAAREAAIIRQLDTEQDLKLCVPSIHRGCLFNVRRDPQERHDLWQRDRDTAVALSSRLRGFWASQTLRSPPKVDKSANPSNFNYNWLPWISGYNNSLEDSIENQEILLTTGIDEDKPVAASDKSNTYLSKVSCTGGEKYVNFLCMLRSVA